MGSVDLIAHTLDSIRLTSEEIAGAIVYLDEGSMEAFQFVGAFPLLLELGARSVCGLESASPLDSAADWNLNFVGPANKAVIFTSCLLSDAHRYILRCLGAHRSISDCVIFTAISEIAHSASDSPLGPDAFREYEMLLAQDYHELLKKFEKHGDHVLSATRSSSLNIGGVAGTFKMGIDDDESSGKEATASKQLHVSVHHFPMIICPICPRVFVLPSRGAITEASLSNDHEDSLSPGLPSISTGMQLNSDDVPSGITLTAHLLYHLAEKMDLKLEIFSLGDTSRAIGKMMMDMSSLYDVGRRGRKSSGLLLIDRTLDLLTPCFHGDSFLDRILSSLPRNERNPSSSARTTQSSTKHPHVIVNRVPLDIKVPFEPIFRKEEQDPVSVLLTDSIASFLAGWNSGKDDLEAPLIDITHEDNDGVLSGSLLSNYPGENYMEALIDKGGKDGIILIKKWLLEALRSEKVYDNSKVTSGVASDFSSLLKLLSQDQFSVVRNRRVIQLALAIKMALEEPRSVHWDAFVSAEKILNITSAESSQSLCGEIRDFISTSTLPTSQSVLTLRDTLLLSIVGYILAGENFPTSISGGPFSWEEERSLKDAVVDSIADKPSAAKFQFLHGLERELEAKVHSNSNVNALKASNVDDFDDQWDSWGDDDSDHVNQGAYGDAQLKLELRDRVDQLFKVLHKVSSLKLRSHVLREGMAILSKYGRDSYSRKGLLYKVLSAVLAKGDIPGLEHHSSAVGRLFKSGFGRLGLAQAKPKLGDQSILLIFVVGGINNLEAREIMEAVTESGTLDVEVLLGGTTLLTPDDMFELLLGSSSYT